MKRYYSLLICLALVILTIGVYWNVISHDFIYYDDDLYITENLQVQKGLTLEGAIWAFTSVHAGNWHPLTWFSHMLDCEIYGLNPKGHHLTSLLLHIANTLLLFFVLQKATGKQWQCAFVAALFALHPLHVESVAWISERKDVLSTFFWMLTMWAYIRYTERPNLNRYLLILLTFTLGLMSKPMLVSLPFILLLMDIWPLKRLKSRQISVNGNTKSGSFDFLPVIEKIPLIALAALSCIVTYLVQEHGGAIGSSDLFSLNVRIANALVSYVVYIAKMIWPHHLAIFYPHPGNSLPLWQIAGAGFLLLGISLFAILTARRATYIAIGWLWYIGTLIPVIGLVQVGGQSMADRYTYVSYIGLFIIIAWGVPDFMSRWRHRRILLSTLMGILLSVFMACTWRQVNYWRNSVTLFEHTLEVTDHNYLAHNNLGFVLYHQGKHNEAISHYLEAISISPNYAMPHNNMGVALFHLGKLDKAINHFSKALLIKPDYFEAYNNMGALLFQQGKTGEAITNYYKALEINPYYAIAYYNMAIVLEKQGEMETAVDYYKEAISIKTDFYNAYYNMGNTMFILGKINEAIILYSKAIEIKHNHVNAHCNLGIALFKSGNKKDAIKHLSKALRIKPDFTNARKVLDIISQSTL